MPGTDPNHRSSDFSRALSAAISASTTADEATATTRDGVSSHRSSQCDSSELENQQGVLDRFGGRLRVAAAG